MKDGTKLNITVQIAVLPPSTKPGRRRDDGSFAVAVDAPMLGEGERTKYPRYPSRMYVHLVGMSGVSLTIEQQYSGGGCDAGICVRKPGTFLLS